MVAYSYHTVQNGNAFTGEVQVNLVANARCNRHLDSAKQVAVRFQDNVAVDRMNVLKPMAHMEAGRRVVQAG